MTDHTDASREGSGSRVDPSRFSPDEVALTKPSVSLPLELQAWARLARAAMVRYSLSTRPWFTADEVGGTRGRIDMFAAEFIAFSTPERILGLIAAAQQQQRIVDLVTASGTRIEGSRVTPGWVVVVDGRTGLDARGETALDAMQVLFDEADGGESPSRLYITASPRAPSPESSDHGDD